MMTGDGVRRAGVACLLLLGLWLAPASARELELHVEGEIPVGVFYHGARLHVRGQVTPGSGVLLRLVGPQTSWKLGHKSRSGPLWLSDGSLRLHGVPGVFWVLGDGGGLDAAREQSLGLTFASALDPVQAVAGHVPGDWRSPLLERLQARGVLRRDAGGVTVDEQGRFAAGLTLPAWAPAGAYTLSAFALGDGRVLARRQQVVNLREVGLESWLSRMAAQRPWWFGGAVVLTVLALGAGVGAALARLSRRQA